MESIKSSNLYTKYAISTTFHCPTLHREKTTTLMECMRQPIIVRPIKVKSSFLVIINIIIGYHYQIL